MAFMDTLGTLGTECSKKKLYFLGDLKEIKPKEEEPILLDQQKLSEM